MSLLMKALASAEKNNKAAQKPDATPALELEAIETLESPSTPLEVTDSFKAKQQAAANMFNASAPELATSNRFSYVVMGLLGLVFVLAAWFAIQLLKLNAHESEVLMAQGRPHIAPTESAPPTQPTKINSVIAHQLEEPINPVNARNTKPRPSVKPKPKRVTQAAPKPVEKAPAEIITATVAPTSTKPAPVKPAPAKPVVAQQIVVPQQAEQNGSTFTANRRAQFDNAAAALPVIPPATETPLPPLVAAEDQPMPDDRVIFGEINSGAQPNAAAEQTRQQPQPRSTASSRGANIEVTTQRPEASVSAPLLAAYKAFVAGSNAQAKSLYRSVLKNDVRQVDALLGMAAIAQRQSRDKDAVGWYRKVLEIEPQNAVALTGIVSAFPNANPVSQIERLNHLIEKQPTVASHHAALGNLYSAQNAWGKAQEAYFNANRYNKQNADYAFNLAISLEHLGKPSLAAAQYQRALNLVEKTGANSPNKQLIEARLEALK